jgi:hypothetical protein
MVIKQNIPEFRISQIIVFGLKEAEEDIGIVGVETKKSRMFYLFVQRYNGR